MSSTVRSCRPRRRRCTCTRSMQRSTASPPATALSAYRDSRWAEVIFAVDPDPASADVLNSWVVDYWEATHPYSAGGAYVNFMMDEGQDRVRATYRDNYERLAKIKAKYDPTNFF